MWTVDCAGVADISSQSGFNIFPVQIFVAGIRCRVEVVTSKHCNILECPGICVFHLINNLSVNTDCEVNLFHEKIQNISNIGSFFVCIYLSIPLGLLNNDSHPFIQLNIF